MKLGIMQPYLFPYIGYFDVINRTDKWVVFDTVKYVPKSWMNRNRILHPTDGWQYFSVPVNKHSASRAINDTLAIDKDASLLRLLGQIEHYRRGRAPFFSAARDLVERCFSDSKTNRLCDLSVKGLELTCKYLGVAFDALVLSESTISLPEIKHPGQWALEISTSLRADEYINPPNGRNLFKQAEFDARNIRLSFTELVDYRYLTKGYAFVEQLSILDAIMWNAPGDIKFYLDECASSAR